MEIGSIYEISPAAVQEPEETHGQSVEMHGQSEEMHGQSAIAHGQEPAFDHLRDPVSEETTASAEKYAEKYGKKHGVMTASGREAIALCLESLAKERPDHKKLCLLPAYMCDSVFFPLERAGYTLCFYPVDRRLEPEKETLRRLVETKKPGLLFLHAYYGTDTCRRLRPLLKDWQGRGICVMEDVTQSLYLKEAGKEADYVVGSLRKWYPVPDGGFAVSNLPFPDRALSSGEAFAACRLQVLTDKWRYLHGPEAAGCGKDRDWNEACDAENRILEGNCHTEGQDCKDAGPAQNRDPKNPCPAKYRERKEAYLAGNRELEERLDENVEIRSMSAITQRLLSREDEAFCEQRRKENCRRLAQGLKDGIEYEPALSLQGTDCAPLYFPVYAKKRDRLQEYLRRRDIYAPVLWPVGNANAGSLSESDRYVFNHLLALPVDQRYGTAQMDRILEVMKEYDNDGNTGGCQRDGGDGPYHALSDHSRTTETKRGAGALFPGR